VLAREALGDRRHLVRQGAVMKDHDVLTLHGTRRLSEFAGARRCGQNDEKRCREADPRPLFGCNDDPHEILRASNVGVRRPAGIGKSWEIYSSTARTPTGNSQRNRKGEHGEGRGRVVKKRRRHLEGHFPSHLFRSGSGNFSMA
jgi:hypothetical protein